MAELTISELKKLEDVLIQVFFITFRELSIFACIWILFFTKWWLLITVYLFWMYFDRNSCEKGGKPLQRLTKKDKIASLFQYFPVKVHGLEDIKLKPEKNYVLVNVPHGLGSWGISSVTQSPKYLRSVFPYHQFFVAFFTVQFYSPFLREFLYSRNLISSSAESINYILKRPDGGNVIVIVPDGLEGMFQSKPGLTKCYIKNRKGFIKLALKNGAPIIPTYTFGEVDLYGELNLPSIIVKFRQWVRKRTRFIMLLQRGRGFIQPSIIPYQKPLNIVFGEPIEVKKNEKPTAQDVEILHKKFIEKLTELFDKHKKEFIENAENIHLEII